jgi:hypothetical protein
MNEEEQSPQPPPNDEEETSRKIIWLFAAFLPSVIGFACLHIKKPIPSLFGLLVAIDVVCSVAAGKALVRGMKDEASRIFLGVFLSLFFIVLNALIVLFIGCSGMGRIAP